MGREIAQVMGHRAAAWLERPSRGLEERPNLVVNALELQPTDVVADIGALDKWDRLKFPHCLLAT